MPLRECNQSSPATFKQNLSHKLCTSEVFWICTVSQCCLLKRFTGSAVAVIPRFLCEVSRYYIWSYTSPKTEVPESVFKITRVTSSSLQDLDRKYLVAQGTKTKNKQTEPHNTSQPLASKPSPLCYALNTLEHFYEPVLPSSSVFPLKNGKAVTAAVPEV